MLSSNYAVIWPQTKKMGKIAFSLVHLLQDLTEKLDIGHKLSSKRFNGQNFRTDSVIRVAEGVVTAN